MDNLCFYGLITFLLASGHCSETGKNSTATDKFLEKLFPSKDGGIQVQNLVVANCENIKEDLTSMKNSLTVQNKQIQCMASSIEDIYSIANKTNGNVEKQNNLVENLVSSVASLNLMMAAQEDQTSIIVNLLEDQEDQLQSLTVLMKELGAEKTKPNTSSGVTSCVEDNEEFSLCYRFYETPKNWSEARSFCWRNSGILAEPINKIENDFVANIIPDKWRFIWLGGTERCRPSGKWHTNMGWDSSCAHVSHYGFTNWYRDPAEWPSSKMERCLLITSNNGKWWFPGNCQDEKPFLCQTKKWKSSP